MFHLVKGVKRCIHVTNTRFVSPASDAFNVKVVCVVVMCVCMWVVAFVSFYFFFLSRSHSTNQPVFLSFSKLTQGLTFCVSLFIYHLCVAHSDWT